MSIKYGQDLGGVRDIDGLKRRCRVDDETGCWVYPSKAKGTRSPSVYVASIRLTMPLGAAVGFLTTGKRLEKGMCWAVTCDNTKCGNPDHRKLMKNGGGAIMKKKHGITRSVAYRLKHGAAMAKFRKLTDEQVMEIRAADRSVQHKVLAERYGVHESWIGKLRTGAKQATVGAGMFSQLLMAANDSKAKRRA